VDEPITIERVPSARGEVVLRRRGEVYEIISNGTFLMDTSSGTSERLLATTATSHGAQRVLIGGLGVGFTLAEVLAQPGVESVTVVEIEDAVVRWNRGPLAQVNGHALDDPRVRVAIADFGSWLASCEERFDAICLDVDNGPDWTVVESNRRLYGVDMLRLLKNRLSKRGRLAVWSAAASPPFVERLRSVFDDVQICESPAANGPPDVVWVASAPAAPASPAAVSPASPVSPAARPGAR
jgi:spermidine synthase